VSDTTGDAIKITILYNKNFLKRYIGQIILFVIPIINIELREKLIASTLYSGKLGLYSPQNFKT